MKKGFMAIIILLFLIFSFQKFALACKLELTPSPFTAKVGDTVTFELERYQTHRSCVLPLEETSITITGGEIIDSGVWRKGNPDVLIFKVKFTTIGKAIVRVERNCPREGLIVIEAKGTVLATQNGMPKRGETVPSPETAKQPEVPPSTQEPLVERPTGQGLEKFTTWLYTTPINYWLWFFFIFGGLILFLFRLEQVRKPWLFLGVIILGFYLGGCPGPVGAVFRILTGSTVVLFVIPVAISIIWGRIFCGWTCPLGAVQEFVHANKLRLRVPDRVEKYFKYLKFMVLIVFGYLTLTTSKYVWGDFEPFRVLFNFQGSIIAVIILIVTLSLSIFIERPFCRYVCPLGAVLSITTRVAPDKIIPDADKCVACQLCTRGYCPMNAIRYVDPVTELPIIDNAECIVCLRCLDICPKKALQVS